MSTKEKNSSIQNQFKYQIVLNSILWSFFDLFSPPLEFTSTSNAKYRFINSLVFHNFSQFKLPLILIGSFWELEYIYILLYPFNTSQCLSKFPLCTISLIFCQTSYYHGSLCIYLNFLCTIFD